MNLSKHDPETEMEMDMTPMIDVVFLLIIFFMIITDLSQQDLEDVQLPLAAKAVPDKPDPEEWRPIINVTFDGEMIVKRETYFKPDVNEGPNKYDDLERLLLGFAARMEKEPLQEGSSRMVPDEPILLRADRTTDFGFIQDIMEKCGN